VVLSRYDAVLSAIDAGVVIHAADTEILEANDLARALLGIRDLEGRLATDPHWVFLESDRSPMTLERFPVMQVIASREPVRGLAVIIQRPGEQEVWAVANALPIIDETGNLEQIVVTFTDVSAAHFAAEVLAAAEEESRLAFDRSRVATCLVSNEGRLIRVNAAICELFGRSEAELIGMSFLDVTHPDDVAVGAELITEMIAGQRSSLRLTKRYVTGQGRVVWGDVTVSAVLNPDGTLRHRIAQILDVSREHTLNVALSEAERIAHVGSWHLDLATTKVTWSQELYAMYGLDPAAPVPDLAEQNRLFTTESWELVSAAIANTRESGVPYKVDLEMVRPDGAHRWMEARGEAVRDANDAIVELRGVSLDITDRRAATASLQTLATHDSLTGLANRAALHDEITRAMSAGRRAHRSTAILMMDLDRFKEVNDTLGHGAGDDLLVAAAARLEEVVRAGDLVARLGGDEFVIVMRDLDDPTESMRAAWRLVKSFRSPFTLGGREFFATASVGVTVATAAANAGDLLREADTAMYAAKEAGRDGVSMFNEDLRTAVTSRLAIEADLRHALERGQLELWYQPEVDLARGSVIAFEALLRWRHPDGTVWPAERFVDVAEDTGLILDIGDWVLGQACTNAADWASIRSGPPTTVRVNVSALQLTETGLLAAIDSALATSGLDPKLLCLEITETTLLRRTSTVTANLKAIHDRGIALAVDDFGTGYASLTYLNQYTVDLIKIDRSFVSDAVTPDLEQGLIAGIIALARTLDITVTAEGVERFDQAQRLRRMGCPSAQGWLYSAAVPPEDVTALLDHRYPVPDAHEEPAS
jgi:diguanylate cyclase (GGDEF)-like protein/PAS domain S-box-containing protein